jgi:helix-turn-helix protein
LTETKTPTAPQFTLVPPHTPSPDDDDLLTYREAGAMLRVSERTIWAMCNGRKAVIPVVKIGAKRFIRKGEVLTFIRGGGTVVP